MSWAKNLVCRHWIYAPADVAITRLVCTRDRGHDGDHEAGRSWPPEYNPNLWVWTDKCSAPQQVPR